MTLERLSRPSVNTVSRIARSAYPCMLRRAFAPASPFHSAVQFPVQAVFERVSELLVPNLPPGALALAPDSLVQRHRHVRTADMLVPPPTTRRGDALPSVSMLLPLSCPKVRAPAGADMHDGPHWYVQMFAPFLAADGLTVKEFVHREVEPLDKEVEQIQIMALCQAMDIPLKVAYLDRSVGTLNFHDILDSHPKAAAALCMLYRPGHYDLIYAA